MKRGIILSLLFIFLFSCTVYASEEDILYVPIEEEEEIKEDYNLLKGTGSINNTKSVVTDPRLAKTINLGRLIQGWRYIKCPIVNIPENTKYRVYVKNDVSNTEYFTDFGGALGYPQDVGYFVRGQEQNMMSFTWFLNGVEEAGQLQLDTQYNSGTNYKGDWFEYIEPTPEPTTTPEPTPDPEEPEVDPETISGNELLREILKTNRGIAEDVKGIYKYISDNSISDNVLSDNTISDNIVYKKLEDYSTSESLALIGLVLAFGALVVYIIHKSVFKIRR